MSSKKMPFMNIDENTAGMIESKYPAVLNENEVEELFNKSYGKFLNADAENPGVTVTSYPVETAKPKRPFAFFTLSRLAAVLCGIMAIFLIRAVAVKPDRGNDTPEDINKIAVVTRENSDTTVPDSIFTTKAASSALSSDTTVCIAGTETASAEIITETSVKTAAITIPTAVAETSPGTSHKGKLTTSAVSSADIKTRPTESRTTGSPKTTAYTTTAKTTAPPVTTTVPPAEKRNITRQEVVDLMFAKETYTWSDFEPYKATDIGSGRYILRYKVDFEEPSEKTDNICIFVAGSDMDCDPEDIWIEAPDDETGKMEKIDFYELRDAITDFFIGLSPPDNTEEDRVNAQKIADYAFDKLKNGKIGISYSFDANNIDDPELASAFMESHFSNCEIISEDTVMIVSSRGGFFEFFGYFVTDGTVEFDIGFKDLNDPSLDGGGVDIWEKYGNVYFFHGGT